MREWSALLLGAILGASATLYYINNEGKVKQQTRQIKAKSKRAIDLVNDFSGTAGRILKR
ncbi:MAG TPA: hypothetical protein PLS54_04005 [Syntrophomonadaceae bacterium]|nr:hypothetical protein [Syntrophomonadaceae bacterium]